MRLVTTYAPGDHRAIVWSSGAMLLADDLPVPSLVALHAQLAEATSLREALESLSAVCDLSVFDVPDFAAVVLVQQEDVQVASRGCVSITGFAEDGPFRVDGADATIWSERTVRGATHLVMAANVTQGLPLVSGVVGASGLQLVVTRETQIATPESEDAPHQAVRLTAVPEPVDESDDESELSWTVRAWERPSILHSEPRSQAPETAKPPTVEPVMHSAPPVESPAVMDDIPAAEQTLVSGIPVVTGRRFSGFGDSWGDGDASRVVAELAEPNLAAQRLTPLRGDREGASSLMAAHMGMLAPAYDPDDAFDSTSVLAVMCDNDHPNPAYRTDCWMCGASTGGDVTRVERPSLGIVQVSSGQNVELNQTIVAGRDPRARVIDGVVPQLLPLQYSHVTANHLEIRLEGWSVLALDLHSRNGTYLRRMGQQPMRVPDQPVLLKSNDVLDLGQGLTLTFGDLP